MKSWKRLQKSSGELSETGKATGVHGIHGEVLKGRGETTVQWLQVIFNNYGKARRLAEGSNSSNA